MLQRMMATAAARPSTSTLSLTTPFTRKSLEAIRTVIAETYGEVKHDSSEKHAAVLVPLCNVNDKPGILLEVRGKLRTHGGEVRYATFIVTPVASLNASTICSFPGGKVDDVRSGFSMSLEV